MSKLCELTGKRPQTGHNVSHANNKTKRRFFPNLKKVSFKSEKLNRDIRIKICTRAIKAVDFRGGIDEFLLRAKNKNLSHRVKKIRKLLLTIVPHVKKPKKEIKAKKETRMTKYFGKNNKQFFLCWGLTGYRASYLRNELAHIHF